LEQARRALEEKAKELALTSKYKSEFLANMSHELRTPLNSILVLGQQLSDNPDGNLTREAGRILAHHSRRWERTCSTSSPTFSILSKIESGTVSVEAEEVFFASLLDMVQRPFQARGRNRRLTFEVSTDPHPRSQRRYRLEASTAGIEKTCCRMPFKFPRNKVGVCLSVSVAKSGWNEEHPILAKAAGVVAFEVTDTGIGIPFDKQRNYLRGFPTGRLPAPAASTAALGLGLAISRELASLLGRRNPVAQRAG